MPPPRLPLSSLLLPCLILVVFWARPAQAFGAGNIASTAKIEGQNWRHGDIEDTLLTLLMSARTGKKFSKMDVKRVYFGNWLRDYSQAVDVGTVKSVSAEAIRILLWVLGFMSFGYGTKEFEVTKDRLGCYRPEEHIDNPKDYADNVDARQYDRRLRGPVDERRELSIDERTGLKHYIASEDQGITTSAGMVRDLLRRCIDLGRRSNRGGNKADFYEALRLLGTATHCMEDYSAHSNYTELALIELGERNVFPHVGRRALFRVQGARHEVYPIITGTFGGVDFLHSVMGEFSDKATQSEIQELEGALSDSQGNQNTSMIKELLNKLPDGIFGGKDQAGKADELQQSSQAAQMQNMHISPKEPEEFTKQIGQIVKQIYPIMEFHDEIMLSINEFIEKIPVLPDLIEQLQEQLNVFVFSLLAPFVVPIINQVKAELETGSSEVIASARDKQLIVFNDDNSTDPTHSMLSKDHFSNVLNEPAGKIASEVLKWAVPQIVQCWDDERMDAERTIQRIITGVFHHPALKDYGDDGARDCRNIMFRTVEGWWGQLSRREQDDLRDKLSREGVQDGRNHKEGVHDKGHGCGKPIGMANSFAGGSGKGGSGNVFADAILGSGQGGQHNEITDQAGKLAGDALGGGALGGIVGGLVGGIGGSLLGGAFGDNEKESQKSEGYDNSGGYTQTYSESGHHKKKSRDDDEKYGQAQYSQTQYPGGGRREEFSRYEQDQRGGSFGYQQKVETTGYSGGGYERTEERRYESGNQWSSTESREGFDRKGEYYHDEKKHHGRKDDDSDDEAKRLKKERKEREKEERKHHKKHGDYGEDSDDNDTYKRRSGEYGRRQESPKRHSGGYGGQNYGGGRGNEYGGGREEYGGGRGNEYGGGQEEYGGGRQHEYGGGREGHGRPQEYGGGGFDGGRQQEYGRREPEYSSGGFGGGPQQGYGRQQEFGRQQEGGGFGGGYGQQESYGGREPGGFGGGYGQREDEGGYGQQQEYGGGREGGGFGRNEEEEEYGQRREGYGGQQYGGGGGGYGEGGYGGGY